jgi:hypothetical protein
VGGADLDVKAVEWMLYDPTSRPKRASSRLSSRKAAL